MILKRFLHLLPLAGLAIIGQPRTALAEFRVCNQTLNLYNVAIGIEKPGTTVAINNDRAFYTEGWWTLPANACVQLVKDDLISRYVYLYAVNINGDDSLSGSRKLCVGSKKFVIEHPPGELWNCWVRGYQEAGFKEIDTGGTARSWTVFIRENQN
jgi:uncharacterized membrane protein